MLGDVSLRFYLHLVEVGVDRNHGGELDHAGLAAVGRVGDEAVADQTHACTVQTEYIILHPDHNHWHRDVNIKLKHH